MKRLLILMTGHTAPEVQAAHGDYDRWFIDAIDRSDLAYDVHDVTRDEHPVGEVVDGAHCGVIVTGSVSAAYRSEPWMGRLAGFLREGRRAEPPVLCVCFGAQLLAHARGGEVNLNPRGWEIGSALVHRTAEASQDPLMAGLPESFRVLATHEDRVEKLPAGCVTLAGNDNASVQAFRAQERVWGVQFHPEATTSIIRMLIDLRAEALTIDAKEHGLPADGHVERLIASLNAPDADQGRRVLQNFVRICLAE